MKGKRYELWWSGNGVVGVLVKEDLCKKVAEVRMVSDRVVTVVVFEEDVLRLICGYDTQSGRYCGKQSFCDELKGEWDMFSAGDLVMCLDDFNGHYGRHIDGFDGVIGAYGVGHLEFGRKNVITVLSGEGIMCVKFMV